MVQRIASQTSFISVQNCFAVSRPTRLETFILYTGQKLQLC